MICAAFFCMQIGLEGDANLDVLTKPFNYDKNVNIVHSNVLNYGGKSPIMGTVFIKVR